MKSIKEILESMKRIWEIKHLILTLSLAVALIAPVGVGIIKQFIPVSQASYQKEMGVVSPELAERTKQIHDQMLMQAFYIALDQEYKEIGTYMEYDEEDVKELVNKIQSN